MTELSTQKTPVALCAYSMPHLMGYLPTQAGERIAEPLTPLGLMDAAQERGLTGVEFPLAARVPSFDGAVVEVASFAGDLRAELAKRELDLIADYGAILDNPAQHLRDYLSLAAEMGAKVVRATLSHILCGDRRGLTGGWEAYLEALAQRLREVLPHAETLGIALAVENHQDATSDDLLRLHAMSGESPAYGITLDAGNPLSVGEDPVEFAQRIAPLIRHAHLKDYTIHFAPEGYRLVRCAAGDGVVDFPAILDILKGNGHTILPAIEIAAQATRTIPLLEADWWACYPPTPSTRLIPALQILWAKGRPSEEPYSSAWERGDGSEAVAAEEWDCVRRSAAYFQSLAAGAP
ncbi:MAG TPA: sugar phosphate isomerase/epimerase [Chthonomonadaceae bacterium]|nr:sugar phosphate isomerase/epimerase [Chthonomonadaceae bacterium]